MTQERTKRKLAAIVSADVKEYSRLMSQDERGTIRTLTAYKEAMSSLIEEYKGRVVDAPGDNLLAEFGSVVDAVNCAVEIQRELAERNAELPRARQMDFRIGINLGDIVVEERRIYGDGVNIAARVESLAEGGGICIAGTVHDHVKNKLGLEYEYLGEQAVKNIPEPVHVYRVLSFPGAAAHRVVKAKEKEGRKWRKAAMAVGLVLIAGAAAAALWNFYLRPRSPALEPASVEKMAHPLPDMPSIAVLPFENLSGDPKQEYLSDGISEAIISALSKVPRMFVIARNSSFTYKGKPVKVQQVAEELGVQYVLEGSVQRSGEKLRVAVQLIDALKGHHLWSERYDLKMDDLLAVQDKIALNVLVEMQVKLTDGEQVRLLKKETNNLKAYEKYLEASMYYHRANREDMFKARQLMEEAIRLDQDFSGAYRMVAGSHLWDLSRGWSQDPGKSLQLAIECAQKALALDENNSGNLLLMSGIHERKGDYEKAIEIARRAVEISPNSAGYIEFLAGRLFSAGRYEEAIPLQEKAGRLNPFPPARYFRNSGLYYWFAGRYEEAIAASKKALHINPDDITTFRNLAAIYATLGKEEEARAAAEEVLRLDPSFSIEREFKNMPWKDREGMERYMDALRKAGLPDGKSSLPLPDKPSIAVLPFVNMSKDPEQEYFSDGITEEIITALSKIPSLFVIARNSTFTYKGKSVKVQQVGRELGVEYVLEGSVRKAEDKVRIAAQLVDAKTGNHLWAERYDRDLKDIFAIQDEITMKIITALQVQLTAGEPARVLERHTNNLQAYLKILEGSGYFSEAKFAKAMECFEEALTLDPQNPAIYGWIAWAHTMNVWFGPSATRARSLQKAFEFAEKCKALDDELYIGHMILGNVYLLKREYDKAISEGRRAVELNPNSSESAIFFGWTLRSIGNYEDAIREYERAIRLNPLETVWSLTQLGTTYVMMRRHEEAIVIYKEVVQRRPTIAAYITLAIAYSALDRLDEARAAASEVLKLSPNFSVDDFEKALPYKNEADRVFMADALRKAGLN